MVVELGGSDVDQREYVERGVTRIFDVMRALDMLPGPPASPPPQVILTELATIRPRTGGLLVPEVTDLGRELGPDTSGVACATPRPSRSSRSSARRTVGTSAFSSARPPTSWSRAATVT
jgi:hypothetical protein